MDHGKHDKCTEDTAHAVTDQRQRNTRGRYELHRSAYIQKDLEYIAHAKSEGGILIELLSALHGNIDDGNEEIGRAHV